MAALGVDLQVSAGTVGVGLPVMLVDDFLADIWEVIRWESVS